MTEPAQPKQAKAGEKPGPGKYVCVDCGHELQLDSIGKDLVKCPTCACEIYNCLPITHIRSDIKTPEDAKNPPKRKETQ